MRLASRNSFNSSFVTPIWRAGRWFHVYPTFTHWTLVDSQSAGDPPIKLCKKEQGVRVAVRKAEKWLEENVNEV